MTDKTKKMEEKTWEEIRKQYPDSWVLIANPVIHQGIQAGIPLFAHKERDEITKHMSLAQNYEATTVRFTGDKSIQNLRRWYRNIRLN